MSLFKKPIRTFAPELFKITWLFVLGFLAIMAVGIVSLEFIMALRSYGYGENLWAKTQKDATLQLLRYAQTGDPLTLQRHDEAMNAYHHFRNARIAFVSTPYREQAVFDEINATGMPHQSIQKGLWLFRYFQNTTVVVDIFRLWATADQVMTRVEPLRDELVRYYAEQRQQPERLAAIAAEIDAIDQQLRPIARQFRSILDRNTSQVYTALVWTEVILGLLLLTMIIWSAFRVLQERHRIEQTLAAERKRAAVILASLGEAVISTDPQGQVTYMNLAAQQLTQRSVSEKDLTSGSDCSLAQLIHLVDQDSGMECTLDPTALTLGAEAPSKNEGDHWMVRPDGSSLPVSWIASPIQDDSGHHGMVLVFRDTTREQQLIEHLSWLATYDPLTNLLNRREFEARLQQALDTLHQRSCSEGLRHADSWQHVLMFIDLDQFKIINDTCGHAAGDEVLQLVTQVMARHVRGQDTLARLGGDEFGVLLLNCPATAGQHKAEEIRQAISQISFSWGMRDFGLGASIGLVPTESGPGAQRSRYGLL